MSNNFYENVQKMRASSIFILNKEQNYLRTVETVFMSVKRFLSQETLMYINHDEHKTVFVDNISTLHNTM